MHSPSVTPHVWFVVTDMPTARATRFTPVLCRYTGPVCCVCVFQAHDLDVAAQLLHAARAAGCHAALLSDRRSARHYGRAIVSGRSAWEA